MTNHPYASASAENRCRRYARCAAVLLVLALLGPVAARAQIWAGYGGNAQHSALSQITAQALQSIHWSASVDLQPQYSGSDLFIHYGSPIITHSNTVILPVKTGAGDGFKLEARRGDTGAVVWSQSSDYSLPAHNWTPSFGAVLTPDNQVAYPSAGGTITLRSNADGASGTVHRLAFYGIDAYNADPALYGANVQICTPITCDAAGNLYFGFVANSSNVPVQSGLARIAADGTGAWIAASAAAGDAAIQKAAYNCAPALSNDGAIVYTAVNNLSGSGYGVGYLVALDSASLNPLGRVRLKDVLAPANDALIPDDGTASPTVGPDVDVYFGVLENPLYSNHLRGWLLHFDSGLNPRGFSGAFGWDDTASVVPASAVPSYTGRSSYLLLTKYNNYVEGGGDGVNKVAIVDPGQGMVDPVSGATVMKEVLTVAGPTPDTGNRDANHPNAVREWCINTAVIDVAGKCAMVNNEDGKLYRWDFTTNTLRETVVLTAGIGEAYTPTLIGPDGTVYAINNATLFAVGRDMSGPQSSAVFVKTDAATQGSWKGVYGADGYRLTGDTTSLPAYASLSVSGQSNWTWAGSTSDVRALQKASSSTDRIASCDYSGSSFRYELNLTDGQAHQVAFYCLDWDTLGRGQTIQIFDSTTNTLLYSQSVTGFNGGKYLVWNITGHVTIQVTNTGTPNGVVSGVVFH